MRERPRTGSVSVVVVTGLHVMVADSVVAGGIEDARGRSAGSWGSTATSVEGGSSVGPGGTLCVAVRSGSAALKAAPAWLAIEVIATATAELTASVIVVVNAAVGICPTIDAGGL